MARSRWAPSLERDPQPPPLTGLTTQFMALSTQPSLKTVPSGNSLVVQWLGFGTCIAEARIQSLVWEIRSSKLLSAVRIKKEKKKKKPLLCVKLFSAYIVFSYGLSSLIKPQRGRAECYHWPHINWGLKKTPLLKQRSLDWNFRFGSKHHHRYHYGSCGSRNTVLGVHPKPYFILIFSTPSLDLSGGTGHTPNVQNIALTRRHGRTWKLYSWRIRTKRGQRASRPFYTLYFRFLSQFCQ